LGLNKLCAMTYWGSGGIAWHIFNLDITWKGSASRPDRFISKEGTPSNH